MGFDGSWQRQRRKMLLFSLGVLALVTNARAQAPQCTFSMSSISFGTVAATNGRPYDATGTFTYACTGDARELVRICPSLGIPKEGPRYMTDDAGHKLFFNLYTDEARTDVWGSWFSKVKGPTIDAPVGRSERVTGSATIYGRIDPNQKDVPPGVFKSSIAGSNSVTLYAYAKNGGCTGSISGPYAHPALTITARVSDGGSSSQAIVAPDATRPNGGSNSVQSGNQVDSSKEKKSLLQKLVDNAAYQQQKQSTASPDEASHDRDAKSSNAKDQQENRAAYLETHSCMTTMGSEKAGQLSDDCNRTTSAPHSACNIQQNTCDEIKDATKRGCDGLGAQAPDFCFTRYR